MSETVPSAGPRPRPAIALVVAVVVLLATSCGSAIVGIWSGTLELSQQFGGNEYPLVLNFSTDSDPVHGTYSILTACWGDTQSSVDGSSITVSFTGGDCAGFILAGVVAGEMMSGALHVGAAQDAGTWSVTRQ